MRPESCVKNYQSDRRMYANYVARNIKKLCKEVGPRPSGSDKELEAQQWLMRDLETSCDEVRIEEFSLAPHAFMAWVQVAVFCGVAGAALVFAAHFLPALALIFSIAGTALLALAIITVIFDNRTLGMVRQWQTLIYGGRFSQTTLDRAPDFVRLAEAYGLNGFRASNVEEFQSAFAQALASPRGSVIDCLIDIDEKVRPMVGGGSHITDFMLN